MQDSSLFGHQSSQPTVRVSLACVPCRAKHIRCDAVLPTCSRCRAEEKQCVYLKSRRGGRRRPRTLHQSASNTELDSIAETRSNLSTVDATLDYHSTEIDRSDSESGVRAQLGGPIVEQLVSLYYSFFHAAHPCVLPQCALKRYLVEDHEALQPLSAVIQYIGSIYAPSISSAPLKLKAQQGLETIRLQDHVMTAYDVQAVLLYSIAVYWCDESEKGLELLDEAIHMALRLGMNQRVFAVECGRHDPILEESWRRTWWQIYITDAHIAGSTQTYPYRTSHVEMGVNLPCEEQNYESGVRSLSTPYM